MTYEKVGGVDVQVFEGVADAKLYLIDTIEKFTVFFDLLMQQKLVACDTETTGFEWYKSDQIVGMSFGWDKTHFYIPVRHESSELGGPVGPQLDMDVIRPYLIEFFAQKDVITLFHNAKFDTHFYTSDGIEVLTPYHDTRILWHLYDENAPGRLKVIASGWKDELGRKHKGLVHPDAAKKEKAR